MIAIASLIPSVPDFFSIPKEAERPMAVKNIFMKKSWMTLSKVRVQIPLSCKISTIIEIISPPITGLGIKNVLKNEILSLRRLPRINAIIAIPRLCKISNSIVIVSSLCDFGINPRYLWILYFFLQK